MRTPADAAYPTFDFITNKGEFSLGLYNIENPDFPDIVQPFLLSFSEDGWEEVAEFNALWLQLQEDFTPELMMNSIIDWANRELDKVGGLTWNERLALIFRTRLAVGVDDKLKLLPFDPQA